MDLSVSVVGDPSEAFPWPRSQHRMWQVPANTWPLMTLTANPSDTIRNIIDRTSREIGLTSVETHDGRSSLSDTVSYIAFGRHSDDTQPPQLTTLAVLDEEGRATWPRDWKSASLGRIAQAADHGLIDGDPEHIYLILPTAFGDFAGFDWNHVVAALWAIREVIGIVSDTSSAADLFRLAYARLKRRIDGVDTIDELSTSWRKRGAAPSDIVGLISSMSRTSEEVAGLLGCGELEAEAILWALGASFNDRDSRWYWRWTMDDELFVANTMTAIYGHVDSDQLREVVERRLSLYIERGIVLDDRMMDELMVMSEPPEELED